MIHPNKPFIAKEVYVTFEGRMHHICEDIECKDWKTLEEGLRDLYPEYDRIEFSTFELTDKGVPDFTTLEDWEIVWREGTRLLLRVEDFE